MSKAQASADPVEHGIVAVPPRSRGTLHRADPHQEE